MLNEGMFIADRYEILNKIGAGGMSDVYKAKDHVLGRFVAIKVLKQEYSEDVNFVTKFRTEAQSAAGLEHPNIVNIYDVGSENGIYYIVMEYIEGITLKTYIEKKGHLSYKEAISIAIQVGRGIEAAHNKQIIHRDIKPQNIMISTEGKVKVTDFGIARAASNNTIHSDVMGSVHYTSPEQARNGFVDNKSDIYSLGIVMYEMVTGRVPFDGDTAVAVAIQHLQEEMVPPSRYTKGLPISLEKIIMKCTQKSPDRRYQTMGDLLVDLKRSLINPDEDFVVIMDGSNQDKTRIIAEDDVAKIKQEANSILVNDDEYDDDEDDRGRKYVSRKYDDDDDEDDDEESNGILNPKMEKVVTIMGIVAAIVIVFIIIYLIGSFFGLFKFHDSNKTTTETQTETQTETETDTNKVVMIDIKGMTFDEAKAELNKISLGIFEEGEQSSDEYEEGKIVSQSAAKGDKVDKNTTIKVVVSSGAGSISVPDVTGKSKADAETALTDAGFKYTETQDYSDTVEEGDVISTTPSSKSSAKKGDTITVVISKGQEIKSFTMPNYQGQDQSTAVNELQNNYGCTVTVNQEYNNDYASGKIIGQSINPGTSVDYKSSITIAVSKGSKPYVMNQAVGAPAGTVGAWYNLVGDDGTTLISTTQVNGFTQLSNGAVGFNVYKEGITGTSTGKLYITWIKADGTSQDNSPNPIPVTFTQAN